MAGFWNAIGLPNAADIQNLTELCRQQAQRIETLENEVRQQRVAIARAVAAKPPIIMADEPTGNLDSASGLDIMRKLTALNEQGTSIILITHDNHLAQMAKRIVTIQDGRIISDMKGGAV